MKYVLLMVLLLAPITQAWEGYDYESGGALEIEGGNLVRAGEEIEIYDYATGEYTYVEVESVRTLPSGGAEVESYDYQTGEYRTFDMD